MSVILPSRHPLLTPQWIKNELWRRARAVPSLDLNFANTKSLVDATTGQNLVTFTRASSGTYVDSQGVIRTATTNLLLRSEEFNNASWVKTNTAVASNQTVSPDGTTTADLLTNTTATQGFTQQIATVGDATDFYTFSVFVKSNGAAQARAVTADGANSGARITFTFATETVLVQNVGANGTGAAGSFVKYADGWYRLIVTGRTTAAGTVRLSQVSCAKTAYGTSDEDGASGIYIWGAQLEQSSTVGGYIPTTSTINSAPRFDHNPTTGESLGLLVEESRTNLLLRSEQFDNASWSPTGLASVAANSTAAPDGTTTADIFVETSGVSETHRALQTVSVTSGVSYAASVFAKQDQRRYCYLIFSPNATWNSVSTIAYFDLQTGVVVSAANCTATITAFPNGWYRCTATATATATNAAASVGVGVSTNGTAQTYTGNGSNAIAVWGAQLEAGSFPTSYIPTTTAAVTRSADVASITGTNFSSWYRQDEGTVFAEAASIQNGGRYFMFDDGVINDRWEARYSSWLAQLTSWKAGSADVTINTNIAPTSPALNVKIAAANKSNDAAIASNGIGNTVGTDNTSSMPSAQSRFWIGSFTGTATYANGTIRRLTYWPQRLSNSTLQQITQ